MKLIKKNNLLMVAADRVIFVICVSILTSNGSFYAENDFP